MSCCEDSKIPSQGGDGGGGCDCEAQNVGTGPGESFRDKTGGNTFNFRTIKSDDGSVDVTTVGDEINLVANVEAPACMPMLQNIGGQLGAAYEAAVAVPSGGDAQTNGLYLGGIFGALNNLLSAQSDQTTLVAIEDPSNTSRTFALVYERDTTIGGRILAVLNGDVQASMPAPVDSHPVILAASLYNDADTGLSCALISGSTVITRKPVTTGEWPQNATMTVRVGQDVAGGRTADGYETGGVFMGVPAVEFPTPDPVALALRPVALSGKLDDIIAGLIQSQTWVANALKDDTSLTPWPELNGGTGLGRLQQPVPVYYSNCTPAWALAQTPAIGENVGGGFEVYRTDESMPGRLSFRTLTGSGSIDIQQDDTTIFFDVIPQPVERDSAYNVFDSWGGGNWVLPKNNADPVIVPDNLKTTLASGNNFNQDASGDGGRVTYINDKAQLFRITCNFTAVRPPQISLDARGQFYLGIKNDGDPDFTPIAGSQQWHRFNIIDCDDVIVVEALAELEEDSIVALMGTSDAGAASDGLGIQIKGYTLTITEA